MFQCGDKAGIFGLGTDRYTQAVMQAIAGQRPYDHTLLQQGTIDACRILAVEGDEVAAAGDVADTQTLKSLAQLPQAPGIAVDGLAKECFVFQCPLLPAE